MLGIEPVSRLKRIHTCSSDRLRSSAEQTLNSNVEEKVIRAPVRTSKMLVISSNGLMLTVMDEDLP